MNSGRRQGMFFPALGWVAFALSFSVADLHAQYRFDSWTTENGLPQNSVLAIRQSRDGYLWFTTADGLVRFDGVRFTVFNKGNNQGIGSNRFSSLYEDREGSLWASMDDRGITRYKNGQFKTFTVEDGLPDFWIWAIREDDAGNLLVVTQHGLAQLRDEKFIPHVPQGGISSNRYWDQRFGGLSFYDASGLYKFEGGPYRVFTPQDGFSSLTISSSYEDQHGTLWVTTKDKKLHRLKGEASTVYSIRELPDSKVTAVCEDQTGNIWIAHGGGISRLKDGAISTYRPAQGAPAKPILSIYEDREGNIWLGSNGDGLYRVKRQIVKTYSRDEGLSENNVLSVLEDREGNIWIGTAAGGLDRLKDGTITHFTMKEGLSSNLIRALAEDRDGNLWIGLNHGDITEFKDGKFKVYVDDTGLRYNKTFTHSVSAIHQDRAGSIWFGHTGGLTEYRDGVFHRYLSEVGTTANRDVKVITQDRAGQLWFGTLGGIISYQDGRFTNYTERDGLSSNHVRAIYEDDEGTLWIGTYDGGLNRFKDGKFTRYTVNEGLFNNGVFSILEDARGNLWMSSNRGVYRVSRKELNDFAAGRVRSVTSVSYDKSDGMLNSECNGGHQPAGWKARDGRLWFSTQAGVVVIDPEAIRESPPPPVHIEEVLLDQKSAEFQNAIQVTPGIENVEIHFTGLSFSKPEQVKFKYKLEGFDHDWVDARTRRVAYYTRLPPGDFVFTVIASNNDGVWNMKGASLRVGVVPPFWRTWWFVSLGVLSLAAATLFAYKRRILKLKRANAAQQAFSRQLIESQENERKRIASELHDSLGQQLLVIKNRALLALHLSESREEAAEELNEISDATSRALEEVREIAYNLRPFQLDRLGLTKAIESMLKKVSAASGIEFLTVVDRIDDLYSKDAEINIYRIVQESANNIVRHSGATRANAEIRRDSRGVSIKIHDNGKGFENDSETGLSQGAGMGIAGISERARILGGKCELHSAPGEGTTIKIQLDIQDNH